MRIIDTVPSSTDPNIKNIIIKIGNDEADLLLAVLKNAYKNTPRVVGTIPTLGRLRNMRKVLGDFLLKNKPSLPQELSSSEEKELKTTKE